MADVVIKADTFMRLCLFTSREWSRYYLHGVCIHQHPSGKGALLAATDGHRLGVWYDEQAVALPKRVILSAKNRAFQFACGIKPQERKPTLGIQRHIAIDIASGVATVFDAPADNAAEQTLWKMAATFPDMLIDGTFPEYERVVPRGPFVPSRACFNPVYLGDFRRMSNQREVSLSVLTTGETGPALVQVATPDCAHFVGVLMSRRGDQLWDAVPGWLPTPAEPSADTTQAAA